MNTETKITQLISKLTRETYENGLSWKITQPPESFIRGTDSYVPIFLSCNYKSNIIGLYQKRYKSWHDEDAFSWSETIGICLLNIFHNVLYEYEEYSPALNNLFEASRINASGLDELLNDLIDD